jgi:ABC-type sugar transport system ATPase subunit
MQGITKCFGPVQALDGVNLRLRPASVHALVGENGAGKSTLMKILAGALQPDSGRLLRRGRPCRWRHPADALSAGVAMIYQELSLAPDLTVAENVWLGLEPAGPWPGTINRRQLVEQTTALAAHHGLVIDPTQPVQGLTAGNCQLVEILKALARQASILVLDEPTSSLGRQETRKLLEIVDSLRQQGCTLVYISHRLEEVAQIADDVTVLRNGHTAHQGPMEEISLPEMVRHMVGRPLQEYYPARQVTRGPPRLVVDRLATARGLRDVSFTLHGGEILGMAGLVGAGRTDLARALFGLDPLSEGSFTIDGHPLSPHHPRQALAQGLMFVTEDRKRTGLCLDLPAAWNMTLPCLEGIGMRWRLAPQRELALANKIGAELGLHWTGPETPALSLSGGNQQKLLFGRALIAQSSCLLLDEPTRGIDVAAKTDVYRLLNELTSQGKAVLLISSELPELFGVADRILVLRQGRIVGDLVTAQTTQEEVLQLAALDGTGP